MNDRLPGQPPNSLLDWLDGILATEFRLAIAAAIALAAAYLLLWVKFPDSVRRRAHPSAAFAFWSGLSLFIAGAGANFVVAPAIGWLGAAVIFFVVGLASTALMWRGV